MIIARSPFKTGLDWRTEAQLGEHSCFGCFRGEVVGRGFEEEEGDGGQLC